jgi:predicted ABC-type ATPase
MVAGPNGSGKTTLTRWLQRRGVEFGEYINPDDIARTLLAHGFSGDVRSVQEQADLRREACIAEKRSFSFETVMSHPSKVDILVRAKEAGFFVQLIFVGTDDPRTNVERVALRVAQGGHDVPEDRIVARWHRTMALLHEAISAVDEAFVFDNSATGDISAGPRLVFCSLTHESELTSGQRIVLNVPIQGLVAIPDWIRRYVLRPLGIDTLATKE